MIEYSGGEERSFMDKSGIWSTPLYCCYRELLKFILLESQ